MWDVECGMWNVELRIADVEFVGCRKEERNKAKKRALRLNSLTIENIG